MMGKNSSWQPKTYRRFMGNYYGPNMADFADCVMVIWILICGGIHLIALRLTSRIQGTREKPPFMPKEDFVKINLMEFP